MAKILYKLSNDVSTLKGLTLANAFFITPLHIISDIISANAIVSPTFLYFLGKTVRAASATSIRNIPFSPSIVMPYIMA